MPVELLSAVERDRLGRFPNPIVRTDLAAYFTLSERDREAIAQLRGAHNRLGFALQLSACASWASCPMYSLPLPRKPCATWPGS